MTSKAYGDARAISISDTDLQSGSLHRDSYVRPGKLFTANSNLIVSQVAQLKSEVLDSVIDALVDVLRPSDSQ